MDHAGSSGLKHKARKELWEVGEGGSTSNCAIYTVKLHLRTEIQSLTAPTSIYTGDRTATPERFAKTAITVSWGIIGQGDGSQRKMPPYL